MKCRVFPENVVELLLEATKEDKDDYEGSNDYVLEDKFTDESFDDENLEYDQQNDLSNADEQLKNL